MSRSLRLLVAAATVGVVLAVGCADEDETVAPASGSASSTGADTSLVTTRTPNDTVTVRLDSYTVTPDKPSVARGAIKFVATNIHASEVHELAVLRVMPDGSRVNTGEVEDIGPRASGEVTLDLPSGVYELACIIPKGEAGSTVDHYLVGMYTPFEVR